MFVPPTWGNPIFTLHCLVHDTHCFIELSSIHIFSLGEILGHVKVLVDNRGFLKCRHGGQTITYLDFTCISLYELLLLLVPNQKRLAINYFDTTPTQCLYLVNLRARIVACNSTHFTPRGLTMLVSSWNIYFCICVKFEILHIVLFWEDLDSLIIVLGPCEMSINPITNINIPCLAILHDDNRSVTGY